jgi:hypothetical protein
MEKFKVGDVVSTSIDICQHSCQGSELKGYSKGNPFTVRETYIDDHGKQHVAASHEHQFVAIDYIEKSL